MAWAHRSLRSNPAGPRAVDEFFVFDGEQLALSNLYVSGEAGASALERQSHIVRTGCYTSNPQSLVMVDGSVGVIGGLVRPEIVGACLKKFQAWSQSLKRDSRIASAWLPPRCRSLQHKARRPESSFSSAYLLLLVLTMNG